MEPLHERIGANLSLEAWRELAQELKNTGASETNVDTIVVAAISFIYNSKPKRLSECMPNQDPETIKEMRAIARHAAINALISVRQHIIDSIASEKDIQLLKSHLLTFTLDYDAGWMNKAETSLWCVLLTVCLHKLLALKSLAGCTTIIGIFRELEYENHGLSGPALEQIRDAEFAERHTEDIAHIIEFLKKNRMSLNDKRLFIVTNETYMSHMLGLYNVLSGTVKDTTKKKDRGSDGNELFVGMIEQANESGQITKHKVFYSKSDHILYCNQNKIRHPIIPDVLLVIFTERMRESARTTASERADAQAMQERIAREQATFY